MPHSSGFSSYFQSCFHYSTILILSLALNTLKRWVAVATRKRSQPGGYFPSFLTIIFFSRMLARENFYIISHTALMPIKKYQIKTLPVKYSLSRVFRIPLFSREENLRELWFQRSKKNILPISCVFCIVVNSVPSELLDNKICTRVNKIQGFM